MTITKKLRSLLTKRDKIILAIIGFATIVISFFELATLSFTMLFISAITQFNAINSNKYLQYFFRYTGPLSNAQVVLLFGIFLIFFYILRCSLTMIYTYYMQKFFENKKHSLTHRFFQNYLRFNYHSFTKKNPATINKLVFADSTNLMTIIDSALKIFADMFTLFLIYLALVMVNWKMTLMLTLFLCIKSTFLIKLFSKKLTQQGIRVAVFSRNINKLYNESYRNFKLIKLLGHENYILSRFSYENRGLIRAQILNRLLQEAPRILLETIGFSILVGAVIYVVYKVRTPEHIIPILAMYALAFYRFIPSITRIINSYNIMAFSKGTIDLQNDLIYQTNKPGSEPISFTKQICLENIHFGYQKNKPIFTNASLTIKKQERIAFIGPSGAGKSTLADIIMGLHPQQGGAIYIDNEKLTCQNVRAWQRKIGYIPQQIYLFDGTVAENIVFGREYNEKKIIKALKKANIYNFLLHEQGIDTKVGEGGILLSGGQMQRIAIARALYSDPNILVLDEATSALDNETETNIMNEIYSLNKEKTLIIIAHRLTTVLKCEKIYHIENKKITIVNKDELYRKYLSDSTTQKHMPNPQ